MRQLKDLERVGVSMKRGYARATAYLTMTFAPVSVRLYRSMMS